MERRIVLRSTFGWGAVLVMMIAGCAPGDGAAGGGDGTVPGPPRITVSNEGLQVVDQVDVTCDRSLPGLTMQSGSTTAGEPLFLLAHYHPDAQDGLDLEAEFAVGYAATPTAVRLAWGPPSPVEATYHIHRDSELIATVRANEYLDTGLTAGEQYEYRIELAADDIRAMFPDLDPAHAEYLSSVRVAPVLPRGDEDCFPTEEELAEDGT
jgi:hypothetical protein